MAKHTDLPIYKVCYDLVVLSMAFTRQMPRDVKLTLGRDLYQECMAMVTLIARANAARDKTPTCSCSPSGWTLHASWCVSGTTRG